MIVRDFAAPGVSARNWWIGGLTWHLFSPWRRDVAAADWWVRRCGVVVQRIWRKFGGRGAGQSGAVEVRGVG
jgi:hypothetical protein